VDVVDGANNPLAADYSFRLDILPGDVTRNGIVQANDVGQTRARQGELIVPGTPPTPSANYSIYFDVSGNGLIQANDVGQVRSRQGDFLPAGDPLPPPALPALAFAIYGAESDSERLGSSAAGARLSGRTATRPDVRLDLNSLVSATEATLFGPPVPWSSPDSSQRVRPELLGLRTELPLGTVAVEVTMDAALDAIWS
jgi:hypothetical protein